MSNSQPEILKKKGFQDISRSVWILGCVSLLTDISSKMIDSILPLFLVSTLKANLLTVGYIEGIAESTASVLKIFSGALSDRIGKRKQLAVFGYGLSTFVKPLFAIATSSGWVLMARFGDRVGKGIRVAPRDAIVADVTNPANRGAAYGLRQSLDTIGAFTGPLLAIVLMSVSGQNYRFVFWIALIPGILAVVLLATGIQEPKTPVTEPRKNPLSWDALKSLGQSYWWLVAVALVFNLGNFSDAFLLLQAKEIGISAELVPLSLVVMNLTYCLSAYPMGLMSDRIGKLRLLVGGFLLYALVYLGFAFANKNWQMWALLGLYGVYQGMTKGTLLALVADKVPANFRGTAFGMMNLATGLALLPASILAGILWQSFSPKATFITGSGFAVIALVLLIVSRQTAKMPRAPR
jgi:MFS family permease